MNKQIIDQYFNKNYNKLLIKSNNILLKSNNVDFKYDLLNEAYFYCLQLTKELTEENIEAIIINYMHKQISWNKTDFKTKFSKEGNYLENNDDEDFIIDDYEDNIEYEFKLQQKINFLDMINLSASEKILFNLRFKENLYYHQIAEQTKLSKTTIYKLVKELEEKIKKQYIIYDNNNI